MVTCVHCKLDLPREAFGKRKDKRNGLTSWCKKCNNERSKRNRESYKRRGIKYWKEYSSDPVHQAYRRKYCRERYRNLGMTEGQKERKRVRQNKEYHDKKILEREKIVARRMVARAVSDGSLSKSKCEYPNCKYPRLRVEAHHIDYSKPLDVVWLCTQHHGLADRIQKLIK